MGASNKIIEEKSEFTEPLLFKSSAINSRLWLAREKKTSRYIQTNDIFVDAWSYSNSIVTDRLISPSLVVENVPFTYADRSPLAATLC